MLSNAVFLSAKSGSVSYYMTSCQSFQPPLDGAGWASESPDGLGRLCTKRVGSMGGPLHCVLPNTNFIITSVLIGPRPTQPQFSSKLPTMCHAVSCLAHFSGLGPPPQPKPPDYDFCLHSRGYLRVILAFCYHSRWISSFPPPRPVTAGSYIGRMGMNSTHTCNRLNTLSFPLYDYQPK
jgi:hypothetical protein